MTEKYKTEQEAFWAGEFGNNYIGRNQGHDLMASKLAMFADILSRTAGIDSVLELGPNIGLNLKAINQLLPQTNFTAVEINEQAVKELQSWGGMQRVIHQSILEYQPDDLFDLVFVSGVLIHINPVELPTVYDRLYLSSRKYILISEYFSSTPVEVKYWGHSGRLFKRDFAGELWEKYPDLKLVGYNFTWRLDPVFPRGDSTWFLFEK
jgi:pseudaminic acid biosynthesis-associated methylase